MQGNSQPGLDISLRDSFKANIHLPSPAKNNSKNIMMSPKGYGGSGSPRRNSGNDKSGDSENGVSKTPRGNHQRTSSRDGTNSEYPMTPSPPNKVRRSSASMGFLATPKFNSLSKLAGEQGMSHHRHKRSGSRAISDDEDDDEESDSHHPAAVAFSPTSRSTRLLPPTTPKSKNHESFMSPTPHLTSPSIYKESNKPIREISNNLKTRLNYALVKLQNGWVDRTLPELESELNRQQLLIQQRQQQQQMSPQQQQQFHQEVFLSPSHHISSSYANKFAHGDDNDSNDENSDTTNSARLAFMKALASPVRHQPQTHTELPRTANNQGNRPAVGQSGQDSAVSPLKWSQTPRSNSNPKHQERPQVVTVKKEGATEVAAIETLMSLSSPKKSKPSVSFKDNDKDSGNTQDSDNDTEIDNSDENLASKK